MPIPVKPCDGSFSEETTKLLVANVGRAQWHLHPCERCATTGWRAPGQGPLGSRGTLAFSPPLAVLAIGNKGS